MSPSIIVHLEDASCKTAVQLLHLLRDVRKLEITLTDQDNAPTIPAQGLLSQIKALSCVLSAAEHTRESKTLDDVHSLCLAPTDFGGLGLNVDDDLDPIAESQVLFFISAYLESLNSIDRSATTIDTLDSRPSGRRGMTLSEKIFATHDVDRRGEVKPGDVVRVDVDWILASELSWSAMERMYDKLGKPGIFRNDRFWIAGDHVVDPRVMDHPKIKPMVESSERARRDFKMTENQGMNYTIMHTEFCRERAQPGMLVLGSDSHTCSAGSVSALAIGLGVADVTLSLITGQTWFRIPESVNIKFINKPSPGIGGKDVILYILKELKRNTIAADRVVEYSGPGVKYLSIDARFAISNMTTEFGGVTGIFTPDEITYDYINRRKNAKYRRNAQYFRPDDDAQYALTHIIDLAKVESFVARYPSPDDVVPVGEVAGKPLDGCFIGACTTAEEDLVLAALVLEVALKNGMTTVKHGKRKVVPGSRPILNKLRRLGLTDVYEQAGFEVGIPGCSYCVGMSADKASEGETWLSSQNRNFENRMGKGSFGNLASAVTVAASSFEMKITDPQSLLDAVDSERLSSILGHHNQEVPLEKPMYTEPGWNANDKKLEPISGIAEAKVSTSGEGDNEDNSNATRLDGEYIGQTDPIAEPVNTSTSPDLSLSKSIRQGKVQTLGDFIDTDALAPMDGIMSAPPDRIGEFCLIYTHPDFRNRVKQGYNIVVAGEAFGCGSSRENAVTALMGAGVQCVIARSFAFIYGRNQPNLGLLGIPMTNLRFYEVAVDGADIKIDIARRKISVDTDSGTEEFDFQLSTMEKQLIEAGGVNVAFERWGKALWNSLCDEKSSMAGKRISAPNQSVKNGLQW